VIRGSNFGVIDSSRPRRRSLAMGSVMDTNLYLQLRRAVQTGPDHASAG
jgi:hypothetical protein